MSLRKMLASLAAAALAAVAPAVPPDALGAPAVEASEVAADLLTVFHDYNDHAVVETLDLRTGERTVTIERAHRPDRHEHDDGAHADGGGDADTGTGTSSTSARCSNGGTWNYTSWDKGGRVRRPWRMSDAVSFNPAGAPVGWDWRAEMLAGSDVWQDTLNPCGLADTIGWVTPDVGDDTSATPCSTDGSNTQGWRDFGGWVNGSIHLASACLSSNSSLGTIVEGDIAYNNNPAVKWCNGACSGGYDLRSVASHEWGHYLGLGHVCNDDDLANPCDTAAEEAAVMYPWIDQNDTQNRTLSRGDVDGGRDLYPHEWGFEIVSITLDDNPVGAGAPFTPGHTYEGSVTVRNTGFRHWHVGSGVDLRASGGASEWAAADWLDDVSATHVDADLTNDQHWKLPNDETTVITGEEALFTFTFRVPFSAEPASGTAPAGESFTLGAAPFTTAGSTSFSVSVGTLDLEVVGQSGPTLLGQEGYVAHGLQSTARVTVRNTGTAWWFRGDDVHLSPHPEGNCSLFQGSDWESCDVVGGMDGASIVGPGEETHVAFNMSAGLNLVAGPQSESFSVEWEGRPARVGPPAPFSFLVL